MIALEITSLKPFMNQLLAGDTFDPFLLEEAVISTANTYTIGGHINRDFFPPEDRTPESLPYEFQPWSDAKGLCFNLIKGKYTPLFFKFVLHLKPEHIQTLLTRENTPVDARDVKALVLSVKYDGSKAVVTTGTAYHTFVMSKEPDMVWDTYVKKYLADKGIAYEIL